MTKILLLVGAAMATVAFVPYIRDILRHGVRPRLVSWVIWTILLALMAVVSVQEKQSASALTASITAVGCFAVVVLGWKYASRGVTQLEWWTLGGALVGLALWLLLDNPLLVMFVAIGVDALAYIPTIVHGWQDPEEESWVAFATGGVGELLVVTSALLEHANLIGLAYPVYATVFSLGMTGVILFSRWWRNTPDIAATDRAY